MKKGVLTAARGVARAVRKDRDHRVIVLKDWKVGRFAAEVFGKPVPDYDCANFSIEDRWLVVKATGDREPDIDGATLAPDRLLIDIAPGYIPHDLGYGEIERMAADPAWKEAGWDEKSIRALWDMVLGQCLVSEAAKEDGRARKAAGNLVARIYYKAVRLLGGVAHAVGRLLGIVAVAFVIAGCAYPPKGFSPSGDLPSYEVVPR